LGVIARTAAFTYKDKPMQGQQVGREIGVRYVLEGSVRTAADKVRIIAQLIDMTTGRYLWAERYDRTLGNSFEIQDEITEQIVTALQVRLSEGERARVRPSLDRDTHSPCSPLAWLGIGGPPHS
jgi:TolB-like protein